MLRQYHIRDYDFKLILLVSALTVIGILAIGSAASESPQTKQTMGFVLGLFLMLVISLFDYSVILRFYWLIYLLNIALLVLVRLIGVEVNGARRWVNILGIQFQPSETAKIMILLFFAQLILRHREQMHSFKMVGMCVILFLPPIALIYEQPDLSTSIMIGLLFCVILLVGGISWKFIIGAISVALPAFVILLMLILQPEQEIINDFQQKRILAWIYPDEYADTTAYQQNNSVVAIGSGMLYGKGYKTNEISSVKNGNFISEPETDFIFAVIGEEFGFVGGCTVIVLLILISFECIMVARRAKDLAGTIVAAGVAALIGFQGIINISVATRVIPNTGIPLPFVSYGLTSLVSLYIGVGFVLNVRLQCKK